jgi:hypothetical protein
MREHECESIRPENSQKIKGHSSIYPPNTMKIEMQVKSSSSQLIAYRIIASLCDNLLDLLVQTTKNLVNLIKLNYASTFTFTET